MNKKEAAAILAARERRRGTQRGQRVIEAEVLPDVEDKPSEVASEPVVETIVVEREPTAEGQAGDDLKSVVTEYMTLYLEAQEEIDRQRAKLVALRGGEGNLTEEDQEALENIRDIVSARYERLLET